MCWRLAECSSGCGQSSHLSVRDACAGYLYRRGSWACVAAARGAHLEVSPCSRLDAAPPRSAAVLTYLWVGSSRPSCSARSGRCQAIRLARPDHQRASAGRREGRNEPNGVFVEPGPILPTPWAEAKHGGGRGRRLFRRLTSDNGWTRCDAPWLTKLTQLRALARPSRRWKDGSTRSCATSTTQTAQTPCAAKQRPSTPGSAAKRMQSGTCPTRQVCRGGGPFAGLSAK